MEPVDNSTRRENTETRCIKSIVPHDGGSIISTSAASTQQAVSEYRLPAFHPELLPSSIFILCPEPLSLRFPPEMHTYTAFLVPALVAATPLDLAGQGDKPSPDEIQIVSASTSGNGCPQGTVTSDVSPDRTVRIQSLGPFSSVKTDNDFSCRSSLSASIVFRPTSDRARRRRTAARTARSTSTSSTPAASSTPSSSRRTTGTPNWTRA